ncbi:lytic transglycosylase domain-containing protein [Photobacterium damselae]|uniref:Lytic transglycosylase domain-containing protein n=1 Tax=Photobacterium damselae subsp. damselae TaxID=85581 RepID=A0A7Y7Q8L6_PHODD|nr:lytic transglycosylase domain-containing protein [Photobacterium damselae]AWK84448.1 hypothetical protein BST98_20660 [Photobacterium damselae]KAB1179949.1 lytic transglycosylase domain-containing protein [Photobacterium damselae subsp. damselae]MBE8127772.1 lytic transglycosylase domain-containing protein [Photobacterium damselae subsp. piscicida]MCG3826235.1 lytic transglycosylase domain-containing protein [Photobacterium damselae]NVO59947.1 lytic transglycosylase domain-containing protei
MIDYVEIPRSFETNGTAVSQVVIERCVDKAISRHPVDKYLLLAILDVENGREGMIRKNAGKTWDLGVGQINTIQFRERWFKHEYKGVNWKELAGNTCLNIDVAARILELRISELKTGESIFNAVGHYHSKTPKYKMNYLQLVMKKYFARAKRIGTGFNLNQASK